MVLEDLYAELEVQRSADAGAIKGSYRKLVLKYHPDKNPENPEAAEQKIRRINNAYETLSNPAKRQAYDAQMRSMEINSRGVRIDTTKIRPRMSIPKAFMLCPMGSPDRFLRAVDRSLCFHTRETAGDVDFDLFFQAARFSLWWLPEVNNMCRLRTQPLISTGLLPKGTKLAVPSGMILSFGLSPQDHSSAVMLSETEQPHCTNLIAVPSPEFEGAYRFQSAFFPESFLAFDPPHHCQMVRAGDQFSVIDFMLTDFGVSERFKTLEEALIPAVLACGGDKTAVPLNVVCRDTRVQSYFKTTMAGMMWDFHDFALHFHARAEIWDYDPASRTLRFRGPAERVHQAIKRSRTPAEVTGHLLGSLGKTIQWLPLDAIAAALRVLTDVRATATSAPSPGGADPYATVQMRVLMFLRDACASGGPEGRERVSLAPLLQLWPLLEAFALSASQPSIRRLREEAREAVSDRAGQLLFEDARLREKVDFGTLEVLVGMPLKWERCPAELLQRVQAIIAKEPLDSLTPLLEKAAEHRAKSIGDCLATSAMMKLFGAEPSAALRALKALASGGFALDGAPTMLQMLVPKVPKALSVPVVAELTRRGASGAALMSCWQQCLDGLADLGAELLAKVAEVAAARPQCLPEGTLGSVASVAVAALAAGKWSSHEALELLAALAPAQPEAAALLAERDGLLGAVVEHLEPRLSQLGAPELVRAMTKAACSSNVCRPLLKAAVARVTANAPLLSPSQLLKVTKAWHGKLGQSDPACSQLLDFWRQRLMPSEDTKDLVVSVALQAGDTVQVFGLTSQSGQRHNGREGRCGKFVAEKGRWEVALAATAETVSLQPKNLKRLRGSKDAAVPAALAGLSPDELAQLTEFLVPGDVEEAQRHGKAPRALLESLLAVADLLDERGLAGAGRALSEKSAGTIRSREQLKLVLQQALARPSGESHGGRESRKRSPSAGRKRSRSRKGRNGRGWS